MPQSFSQKIEEQSINSPVQIHTNTPRQNSFETVEMQLQDDDLLQPPNDSVSNQIQMNLEQDIENTVEGQSQSQ